MLNKLLIVNFFLGFIIFQAAGQTRIVLQPGAQDGKDAMVNSEPSFAGLNWGDHERFVAGAWTFGGSPGIKRSFVDFNLSSIPANANIQVARLSLYTDSSLPMHSQTSGSNDCWLKRITSAWDEHTITWYNQPSSTEINKVELRPSVSDWEDYLDIDVTNLVRDMIQDLPNSHGFLFMLQTEGYYRNLEFASSDFVEPTKAPRLEIIYSIGTGINDLNASSVSVYPVPASDIVRLSGLNQAECLIQVFNVLGERVFAGQIVNQDEIQVPVSSFINGIYTIEISDTNGNLIAVKKLIKA